MNLEEIRAEIKRDQRNARRRAARVHVGETVEIVGYREDGSPIIKKA